SKCGYNRGSSGRRLKAMNQVLKNIMLGLAGLTVLFSPQKCGAESPPREVLPAFVNLSFEHNIMPVEYVEAIKNPQTVLRKVAESLMERKRQFIKRWEKAGDISEADDNFPASMDDVEVV